MRLSWRLLLLLLVVFIAAGSVMMVNYENSGPVSAGTDVYGKVQIAQHDVKVNGIELQNNNYAEYPVLIRDETTYIPLTFHMASLLNIHLWVEEDGLHLETRAWDTPKPYLSGKYSEYNESDLEARLEANWFYINGVPVSVTEPLLEFRDVLYLPATEEVAQCLDWELKIGQNGSLSIDCDNFFYIGDTRTVYKQGDLRVEMKADENLVPASYNLEIARAEENMPLQTPTEHLYFSCNQSMKPLFTVSDGYLYTAAGSPGSMESCRVDLATGKVEFID